MPRFHELVIGGVLVTPFVLYAAGAFLIYLVLRPFLFLIGFDRAFLNPSVAQFGVYVVILALLIVLL